MLLNDTPDILSTSIALAFSCGVAAAPHPKRYSRSTPLLPLLLVMVLSGVMVVVWERELC